MSKEYANKICYLSYSSVYSAVGTVNNDLRSRACFADTLNSGYTLKQEHYELYLVRDPKYAIGHNCANWCPFNIGEVKKHIMLARRLFPFTYSVEEAQWSNYDTFKVTLNLDATHFHHRYLLTWVRYLYEFPFNIILRDALNMKHNYLNKESITNLYVLCANSFGSGPEYYNTGHSISDRASNFLKEKQLKAKIEEIAARNDRYSYVNEIYPKLPRNMVLSRVANQYTKYLDYWIDPEAFEERAKIYLENYKHMTK